jgi:uncharacterized membrane protein YidH (DUF202 family)
MGEPPAGADFPGRARDHLANERTYLAWLRTAAAVMALGLAIAGFGEATTSATVFAGAVLVITGATGVGYGTLRYRRVSRQIEEHRFDAAYPARAAIVASSVLVLAVIVALVSLAVGST